MAKQAINIGTAPNDGTGDPLRTAFDKVNDNFTELYTPMVGDTGSGGAAGIAPAPAAGDAAAGKFLKASGAWATPNLGDTIQVGARASVATTTIPAAINAIRTSGYAAAGDGGDALYKRVVSEPSHAGKAQSADGAWWEIVTAGKVSILALGAVPGAGDIASALQAAHDALPSDGGVIDVPGSSSYYAISSAVDFTKPIVLIGGSIYASEILTTTDGLVVITAHSYIAVHGLNFTALGDAIGTCKWILHAADSANHNHSYLQNNYFSGAGCAYHAQSTNCIFIQNNIFSSGGALNVLLENQVNSDIGDSFICGNTFSGVAATENIKIVSTSGCIISGNKFLIAAGHVLIDHATHDVGDFVVANNSIEGHIQYGVKISGTTGTCTKTVITGNQISSDAVAHIDLGASSENAVITGNHINGVTPTGIGVNVDAGNDGVLINSNSFRTLTTAIAGPINNCAGMTVRGNRYAADVSTIFTGDDQLNALASSKNISTSRVAQESSGTYVGVFKFKGQGILNIHVYGIVQGVGYTNYTRKVIFTDTTFSDLTAAVIVGTNFLCRLEPVSGFLEVQIAKDVGTSLTVYVEIEVSGQVTHASAV